MFFKYNLASLFWAFSTQAEPIFMTSGIYLCKQPDSSTEWGYRRFFREDNNTHSNSPSAQPPHLKGPVLSWQKVSV